MSHFSSDTRDTYLTFVSFVEVYILLLIFLKIKLVVRTQNKAKTLDGLEPLAQALRAAPHARSRITFLFITRCGVCLYNLKNRYIYILSPCRFNSTIQLLCQFLFGFEKNNLEICKNNGENPLFCSHLNLLVNKTRHAAWQSERIFEDCSFDLL